MVDTSELIKKLSGTPYYGSRILVIGEKLQKAYTFNGVQIYINNGKYYFKYPEDNDVYICIGKIGICDEIELSENFAKIISALELKTEKRKLVSFYDKEETPWWYN